MTPIFNDLKRQGGDQLSDWTAPTVALTSPDIIAQAAYYDLTVLTRFRPPKDSFAFAKVWSQNKTGAAANVLKHTTHTVQIPTLAALYDVMADLAHAHNSCVIRGQLTREGRDFYEKNHFVYRRSGYKLENGKKTPPHFEDTPRAWACFDADDILTPFDITTHAAQSVAWYIENHLPPCFKNVGYVWQLSGSAGHPKKNPKMLRAHVWVLLTEPRTSAQVKTWAAREIGKKYTDLALFQAVQAHYTSNPVLRYCEYKDPCITRLGIVQGQPLHVPIVLDDLSHIKIKREKNLSTKTEQAIRAANGSAAWATDFLKADAKNALERSVNTLRATTEGNRDNTLNRLLYYVYGYVHAGALDENVMLDAMWAAADQIGIEYQVFWDKVNRKRTNYAPLDNPFLPDDDEYTPIISDKPLVTHPSAIWQALRSVDTPYRDFDACIDALTEISDPLQVVSMAAHTVNLLANGTPFRYCFNDRIKKLESKLDNHIHPFTFTALRKWGEMTSQYIKARACSSVVISDEVKARHFYEKIDKLADAIPMNKARVMLVRVAMGEGKTALFGRGVCDHAKQKKLRFAALTHRSALVEEMCRVLNLTSYKDVGALLDEGKKPDKIYHYFASCLNSIASPYVRSVYESCDILFIDEAAQVIRAFVALYNNETSTAKDSTAKDIYDLLVETIRRAPKVVLCDAGANDELIEWLESILDNEKVHIVETDKKSGDGVNVIFNFAKQQLQGEAAALEQMIDCLKQGKKIWVSVGTVKTGKMLYEALKKYGHGFFIQSKTPTAQKKGFLADIDKASLNFDFVIASPVISCGTSITHKDAPHFDEVFFLGDGSSVTPQDVIQMIRRVRYVKKVHVFSWLTQIRLGENNTHKKLDDFYNLKMYLTANQNWERQNFCAALAYTLESTGFNVKYHAVKGDMKPVIEGYKTLKENRVLQLNAAPLLSLSEYESLKKSNVLTQSDLDAIDKFELCEHLANVGDIDSDDLSLWNEGRGRELLARRAACLGIVLNDVEHSSVLCDLYARIFEGVNIQTLNTLDTTTAETIVKNAANVGRIGVQYELLPQSYAKKSRLPKNAVKSALVILRQCGYEVSEKIRPQSHLRLKQRCESGHKTRERITLLRRDLIEKLDEVITRRTKRADDVEQAPIIRPLPDKVTVRTFTKQQAAPLEPDLSTQPPNHAQIKTIESTRPPRCGKCRNCLSLDITEQGDYCLMQGEIPTLDVVRACESFTLATACF